MSDYEPDYVYMIPLPYKTQEVFYENITHAPAVIKGAFLTDDEKKDKIDMIVYGPNEQLIYHNSSNECIFEFTVPFPCRIRIVFTNRYINSDAKLTFTMNTGQNPILKKDDLSSTDQKLDSLVSFLKRFNLEFKLNRNIHQERYKSNTL